MRFSLFLLFAALFCAAPAMAQDEVVPAPDAKLSPLRLAKTTLGDTYVKVHYGSPQKRDRVIFGELVPFGQVWRTGANEATEITITGPVMFGSAHLEAGTYAVFTIPGEESWTVIFNNAIGQWGAFAYDEEQDAARVQVPVESADAQHEAFTISFEEVEGGAHMRMTWDRTSVAVPLMAH